MSAANATDDIKTLQQTLVDDLVERKVISSDAVERAFRAVPRHLFLPDTPLTAVYSDRPIVTKRENGRPTSSSSQPTMMAIMLEQLAVCSGENVLEVGAGTGYNAALLGSLVGKNGRVTSIDIDPDIVEAAQSHLQAAGADNVQVVCADGTQGFAANAPYDCLILTVGGWDISPEWLAQLKPNGRIVLPFSLHGPQMSVAFVRKNDQLVSSSIKPCGFMRMQGPHAEPEFTKSLSLDENIVVSRMGIDLPPEHFEVDEMSKWLSGDLRQRDTAVLVTMHEIWSSLSIWLTLQEQNRVFLEDRDVQTTTPVPFLYSMEDVENNKRWMMTVGLCLSDGMAFLMRPSTHQPFAQTQQEKEPASFPLFICGYGPRDTAVQQLQDHILQWDRAGRPQADTLHIEAVPISSNYSPKDDAVVVKKKWHRFRLKWERNNHLSHQ